MATIDTSAPAQALPHPLTPDQGWRDAERQRQAEEKDEDGYGRGIMLALLGVSAFYTLGTVLLSRMGWM